MCDTAITPIASSSQKQIYDLLLLGDWNTIAGLFIGWLKKLLSQSTLFNLQGYKIRSYDNSLQVNSLRRGFFQCPIFLK